MSVHCEKCGQAKYLSALVPKLEERYEELLAEAMKLTKILLDPNNEADDLINAGLRFDKFLEGVSK